MSYFDQVSEAAEWLRGATGLGRRYAADERSADDSAPPTPVKQR